MDAVKRVEGKKSKLRLLIERRHVSEKQSPQCGKLEVKYVIHAPRMERLGLRVGAEKFSWLLEKH